MTAILSSVTTEGGLLHPELLERVVRQDPKLAGLTPADYHSQVPLGEAASRAWTALQPLWRAFRFKLSRLGPDDAATALTRDAWLLPLFRELGWGPLAPAGDAFRAILLDRHDLHLDATTEMLLYMAARAQLVAEVIRPALDRGDWVVSDRYLLANVVYQGHAGGLAPDRIRAVGEIATGGLMPDLVIVLDVDLDTAARRIDRPLDKLESRGDDYRRRLRDGFCAEAARDPGRIRIIDGTAAMDEVAKSVQSVVREAFFSHGR